MMMLWLAVWESGEYLTFIDIYYVRKYCSNILHVGIKNFSSCSQNIHNIKFTILLTFLLQFNSIKYIDAVV